MLEIDDLLSKKTDRLYVTDEHQKEICRIKTHPSRSRNQIRYMGGQMFIKTGPVRHPPIMDFMELAIHAIKTKRGCL